jgi:hypothetical protein
MRLVERNEKPEDHFTEGELDLEAPEELALAELDDDTLLEEELDNDDISEEDVDETVLEVTLEDLVHSADDGDDDAAKGSDHSAQWEDSEIPVTLHIPASSAVEADAARSAGADDLEEGDDLEVADLEDVEESLDHILAERLAGDTEASGEDEEDEDETPSGRTVLTLLHQIPPGPDGSRVAPCRDDEFVCRSCFLVRKRAQLAHPTGETCRDCSS